MKFIIKLQSSLTMMLTKVPKQAVLEFCQEQGIGYITITDACGTVIIAK